jgi:D-alanine--poly(phosphoribitol) ligase subunit 2
LPLFKFAGEEKVADPETLANEVAEIFSQNLHIEVPSHDFDLFTAGILDSLQLVELLFQLEEQFGIQISLGEIDLETFRSIDCIALMLVRRNCNGAQE